MFRLKILISIIIFSSLLFGTSIIKNQTRDLEKKIFSIRKLILMQEKDLYESQLDYSYLTSPSMLDKKIETFNNEQYLPMDYSKIFLSLSDFVDFQKKFVIQKNEYEKKTKKK